MHYSKSLKLIVLFGSISLLVGCGSPSSTSLSNGRTVGYYGAFVDSATSGISWSCGEIKGTTGIDGVFGECPAGSDVTFSVGNVVLGNVSPTADNIFTPQDIVGVSRRTIDNDAVKNMATLLLSLDSDPTTDGISITPEIITAFEKAVPTDTKMENLKPTDIEKAVIATNDLLPEITLDIVSVEDAASHLIETAVAIEAGEIEAPVQPEPQDNSTD